jgi:hypothetical protein
MRRLHVAMYACQPMIGRAATTHRTAARFKSRRRRLPPTHANRRRHAGGSKEVGRDGQHAREEGMGPRGCLAIDSTKRTEASANGSSGDNRSERNIAKR